MTRLLSAFGKAVSFTARGAAVTFGSTVFSCVAACSIEKSANRMILKHYPHKFANVEAASGITQEELDFVKFKYGGRVVAAASADQETDKSPSSTTATKDAEVLFRYDYFDESSVVHASRHDELKSASTTIIHMKETATRKDQEEEMSTVDKFWTEGEEAAAKALSFIPAIIVPRQEILACSMTA